MCCRFNPLSFGSKSATLHHFTNNFVNQKFQSPIIRVKECNLILLVLRLPVGLCFNPLSFGSKSATPGDLFPWQELLDVSIPYHSGQRVQRKLGTDTKMMGYKFQSPIIRVKECNFDVVVMYRESGFPFQSPIIRVKECNPIVIVSASTSLIRFNPLSFGSKSATML